MDFARVDVKDEKIAEKLWKGSETLIERVEREEAVRRALEKNGKGVEVPSTKVEDRGEEKAEAATGSGADAKKSKSRRQKKKA